jgi:hypothetical protein
MKEVCKLIVAITLFNISSCSFVKITEKSKVAIEKRSIDKITILTQFDSVPQNLKCLGSFKLVENKSGSWGNIITKIDVFARKNNANIVKINEFHMNGGKGTRMNLGFVTGKLYSGDIVNLSAKKHIDSVMVYISRYEKDNFLSANFKYKLYVNNILIGDLKNKTTFKLKVKVGDKINFSTQKNNVDFSFDASTPTDYYISALRHYTNNGLILGAVDNMPIGNISIDVSKNTLDFFLLDEDIGKLEYENIIQLNKKQKP